MTHAGGPTVTARENARVPFRRSSSTATSPARSGAEPAPGDESRVLNVLGWAGRTDVERVQRYTEWSLHSMLWFFLAVYVAPAAAERVSTGEGILVLVVMVVLAVAGSVGVRSCMERWPSREVPWRDRWFLALLTVLAASVACANWLGGSDVFGLPMGIGMTAAWGLGGLRGRWLHIVLLTFCGLQAWVVSGDVQVALVVAGFSAFLAFTMQSSLWLLGVVRQLDRARRTEAELAVAQERLRFSSDVHDVMGRHLSTIAVQAELAGALLRKGDPRAAERIEQVRASAHDALREARELARGYRPLDLAQEIEGASSLLASAGVTVDVQTSQVLGAVPDEWREPVAKVIRESVTNVLRHSRATRVSITCVDSTLRIANDGVRASATPSTDGSGLRTLSEDVVARGGTLTHAADGETFVLTLNLPRGAGTVAPLTAPATEETQR